jgi:2-oxoglutarate dehydrogenase E1 component
MQNLDGYKVGGTVHIVVNNQIGFTTTPIQGRSGLHCTEVAKAIDAPIIHVNGDDADMVDAVMRAAVLYRNKFQKDIVVNLVGYRRYGHNEQDQPAFTQPMMYKKIEATLPVFLKYTESLLKNKQFTSEEIQAHVQDANSKLEVAYAKSRSEAAPIPSPDEVVIST